MRPSDDGYGSANLRADGGETAESSVDGTDREVWWGKPANARKPHLFDGPNKARSLCGSWGFYSTYASEPLDLNDPQDGYDLDDLCKRCRESVTTETDRSRGGGRE